MKGGGRRGEERHLPRLNASNKSRRQAGHWKTWGGQGTKKREGERDREDVEEEEEEEGTRQEFAQRGRCNTTRGPYVRIVRNIRNEEAFFIFLFDVHLLLCTCSGSDAAMAFCHVPLFCSAVAHLYLCRTVHMRELSLHHLPPLDFFSPMPFLPAQLTFSSSSSPSRLLTLHLERISSLRARPHSVAVRTAAPAAARESPVQKNRNLNMEEENIQGCKCKSHSLLTPLL